MESCHAQQVTLVFELVARHCEIIVQTYLNRSSASETLPNLVQLVALECLPSTDEVMSACQSMSGGRVASAAGVCAELLKYGGIPMWHS